MSTDLHRLVSAHAADMAEHVRAGLESEVTPHYSRLSDQLLRLRCGRLVDAFVASVDGDSRPFLDYVNGIANERMAEGVGLDELQRALTLLEGSAWTTVVEGAGLEDLPADLGIVTTTIGAAKDALARRYVAGPPSAGHGAVDVASLFAGTDVCPDTEQ
jgi:hypothetical protein